MNEPLKQLRSKIDSIDEQLLKLLNERAQCARDIATVKQQTPAEANGTFYRPEREAQVLKRIMQQNRGPLKSEEVARLFREIMSTCLALERPLTIAFLGPEGTFTQAATLKHFGHATKTSAMNTIEEVFREVEAGTVDYGVVPVENSTEGMVSLTLDCFMNSALKICGEVELRIHHHLLTQPTTTQIQRIYSHQQSLAQCRQWLDKHWPTVERIAVSSNAEAAKLASKEANAAAIAGEMAEELYGLKRLAANIEDQPDNTTRFLVIGHQSVGLSGEDKTSIIVSTRNEPGALYSLLAPFHKNNINLTRIETRPSRVATWAYVFFIDFEGHQDNPAAKKVLQLLQQQVVELKNLGSYPRAVL